MLKFWIMASKDETFSESISACFENGNKLLEDAKLLFEWDRFSTALALSILSQEEFAKTFLLQLVADGALPWLPEIHRSMTRHQCKHLLAIVMEWLPPFDPDLIMQQMRRNHERHERWMAWSERRLERYGRKDFSPNPEDPEPVEEPFSFPVDVATALNIYRYEEIERLGGRQAWTDADWATGKARKIAEGLLDRKKQSALYVDISKTGEIGLNPNLITREEASEAIKRAERFSECTPIVSDEYQKLKETLPLIFSRLKDGSDTNSD
jgi:AbiV family abortive infection protein